MKKISEINPVPLIVDIKVRLSLECMEDCDGYKKGDQFDLTLLVMDEGNGLVRYAIDEKFEIINYKIESIFI